MYTVYVNGEADTYHETVEDLAEYLLVSGLISQEMSDTFESNIESCDTCVMAYDVLFAYLEKDVQSLCNTADELTRCLHDAVRKSLADVISNEHGCLEYVATSGEKVRITRGNEDGQRT